MEEGRKSNGKVEKIMEKWEKSWKGRENHGEVEKIAER